MRCLVDCLPAIDYIRLASRSQEFLFEKKLNNYIYRIVTQFYDGKPSLVFCSTRTGALESAKKLVEEVWRTFFNIIRGQVLSLDFQKEVVTGT